MPSHRTMGSRTTSKISRMMKLNGSAKKVVSVMETHMVIPRARCLLNAPVLAGFHNRGTGDHLKFYFCRCEPIYPSRIGVPAYPGGDLHAAYSFRSRRCYGARRMLNYCRWHIADTQR